MSYNPDLRFITEPSEEPLCIVPNPLGGVSFQIPNTTSLTCHFTDVQQAKAFAKANGRSVRVLVPKQDSSSSTNCLPDRYLEKAYKLIRS